MYSKKFEKELLQIIRDFKNRINMLTIVSYDEKNIRELVSRYEELVPELRDYHVELNEAFIMSVISLFSTMMKYFDPAPAEKTRVIKNLVSKEKMDEYARILKGSPEEIKASLETAIPDISAKLKEWKQELISEEQQLKYKFAIIRAAQKQYVKNGKISMSKAVRDYLRTHTGDDIFKLDEEDVEAIKREMSRVNKFFLWICEHENAILKEVAFYMSKEKLLVETIKKKYANYAKETHNFEVFLVSLMIPYIESEDFKYTKMYDEYLETQVEELIAIAVELGEILKD